MGGGGAGRPRVPLLPPRWRADRAGSGDGYFRLERDLRDAAARSRQYAGRGFAAGNGRPGHRCSGFEQDRSVARVLFADGATAEADIVIAADGIHSELRPYVFPPSSPVFMARSLTAAWWRMSAGRTGRPTAGKCGSAREGISAAFRSAPAS
jgi:2-polyprenyl-6-methoxyphenol hydroxylase-like FAD-dependent oxidoreductase